MANRTKTAAAVLALVAFVAACAGTPETPPDTQAIRDYVEVGELQEVGELRTTFGRDEWAPLTRHFVIYTGRDGQFLLEFSYPCREMFDNTTITADKRYDRFIMRRGVDTLRGCRIDKIYPLTEAQAQEIEALVKTAGGGN
jgi:hypothetical protein